ncbi:MAG: CYTH domain-containing protein [bacterium]
MPHLREIERKFLVRGLREGALAAFPGLDLEQHYLSGCQGVRIRRAGTRFILTIKGRGSLDRVEVEKDLTEEEYAVLLTLSDRGLAKRRYRVGRWEVDIFKGALSGLALAEIELSQVGEALSPFPFPDAKIVEVTEDPRFTNSSLAWGTIPSLEEG